MGSGGLLAEGLVLKSDVELGEKPDMTGLSLTRWHFRQQSAVLENQSSARR